MLCNDTFIKEYLSDSSFFRTFVAKLCLEFMYREKIEELKAWKNSPRRKPLILRGARQVGKTWLLREFGRQHYANTVYVNFEQAVELRNIFDQDYDVGRILQMLQLYARKAIDADTLIILDEIQAAPRGLTALKYFCEEAPQQHIVAAVSLLGMGLHGGLSFPVGKVNFIDLHPMTFDEFLLAIGEQPLVEAMRRHDWEAVTLFADRLTRHLKNYYYTGGMPEAVGVFADTGDYNAVRRVQREIIRDYENDFSKHAPVEAVSHLFQVWQSIPSQLDKENKKFVYGIIREGARSKDFELAIQWLVECGLLLKCHRVKEPRLPLIAYQELAVFKLFLIDVGLLAAMAGLDQHTLLHGGDIFTEFKGALTEQYVMQQLHAQGLDYIGYWSNDRSTAEVDFVVQAQGQVTPIEVKAEENLRSKSFRLFCGKYHPWQAIRASMRPYRQEEWMTNVPLYDISHISFQP